MRIKILVPAALAFVLLSAAGAAVINGRIAMQDFQVNRTAADRLAHGESLYRTADEHYQFKYSPFCALIYLPFSRLPLPVARVLWFLIIIFAAVFALDASARLAGWTRGKIPLAAFLPGLILLRYFLREIELGQINAVITALFLGLAGLLEKPVEEARLARRRDFFAGFLWGLGAAMKPYGLIFAPYLLLKRRWTALASGAFFLAASLLLPGLFYGFSGNLIVHKEWVASLSRSTPPLLVSQDNVSLLGALSKWLGPSGTAAAVYGAVLSLLALAMLIVLWRGTRLSRPIPLEAGLLLLFIPLLSPLGWDYTFLSAVLAVSVLVHRFSSFGPAWRALLILDFALMGLSLYDVLGRSLYSRYMALSIPTLCFLIIAAALVRLRLIEARERP